METNNGDNPNILSYHDYKGGKDWTPQWDDGLNTGLVHRPPAQASEGDEHAKPAYYAESNPVIPYVKALIYAGIAVVPYLAIFDTLGAEKTFMPCNNVTCHYMRLFNSKFVPATGAHVMGVKNGVARPVGLHYDGFDAYSCPEMYEKNRTFAEMLWGPQSTACPTHLPIRKVKEMRDSIGVPRTIHKEEHAAQKVFSMTVQIGFKLCKGPLRLFSLPFDWIAKLNPEWGMEHIPSGICPHMKAKEMRAHCSKPETMANIRNHLQRWSPAKIGGYVGLAGFACFTAIHDVLVLARARETVSLFFGFLSTGMLGCATLAIFFWAMGAAEVFVAPAMDGNIEKCACFYQIPEITALVGLASPFALFALFMGKVQMQGLACLFGDFLAFQVYYVPHYLAHQSFLWTWGVLASPKMVGTIQGKRRPGFSMNDVKVWRPLRHMQTTLYWGSVFLQAVVALTASAFMIAFKELCVSLYLRGDMTPTVLAIIKWVLLPGPSVAVIGLGAVAMFDLICLTVWVDKGEGFIQQMVTLFPFCREIMPLSVIVDDNGEPTRTPADRVFGTIAMVILGFLLLAWTLAVAQGLSPDKEFLFGSAELRHPHIAQAELWGACGFIFFLIHVPRVVSIAFTTWEEIESLKFLADPDPEKRDKLENNHKKLCGGNYHLLPGKKKQRNSVHGQ